MVGIDFGLGRALLTRVLAGGRGSREYPIDSEPVAVAVGEGPLWVLRLSPRALLQLDQVTGAVVRTMPLPHAPHADGLPVGEGAVFVMESGRATLHRFDPRSGRLTKTRRFGAGATEPVLGLGSIWFCAATPGASIYRVDASTLATRVHLQAIPAEEGRIAVGHGPAAR